MLLLAKNNLLELINAFFASNFFESTKYPSYITAANSNYILIISYKDHSIPTCYVSQWQLTFWR